MLRALALATTLLLPLSAAAHDRGLSLLTLRSEGATVRGALAFHAEELDSAAHLDRDGDGALSPAELEAGRGALLDATVRRLGVAVAAGACELGGEVIGEEPGGGIAARATWRCPSPAAAGLELALGHLALLPRGHRTVVEARLGARRHTLAADASGPRVELAGEEGGAGRFGRFFVLGVEHIFTGFDHLLFLAGLILVAAGGREVAKLVTAFTVAHSLTLAAAVTGVFSPAGAIVEPLIALSIVVVAVENLVRRERRGRAALAFAFGLIHGFGFAGLLRELGLGDGPLAAGLAGFNLGVEAGQLCVVAAVAPLVALARRRPWYGRVAVPAFSAGIAFAGAYWFVERLAGS